MGEEANSDSENTACDTAHLKQRREVEKILDNLFVHLCGEVVGKRRADGSKRMSSMIASPAPKRNTSCSLLKPFSRTFRYELSSDDTMLFAILGGVMTAFYFFFFFFSPSSAPR